MRKRGEGYDLGADGEKSLHSTGFCMRNEENTCHNFLPSYSRYDMVREGVVVFLGTLARHLPPGDSKRTAIVETLVAVLGTPSEVSLVNLGERDPWVLCFTPMG